MSPLLRASLVALALVAPAAAASPDEPARLGPVLAGHLERLSPTVVTLKFVMRMRFGDQESESNAEVRATVVDASGIVMTASSNLEAGGGMFRRMRAPGMEVKSTPSDFKVIVGNDPKEHDATLLAQDSRLGLSFLQMLSTEGAALRPADLSKPKDVAVGDALFGISRLGRGFDYAPVVDTLMVTGKVEKPRPMWDVSGGFRTAGVPVYDAGGAAVGVLSTQQGAEGTSSGGGGGLAGLMGGGEGSRLFLLPLGPIAASVEAAKKRAPEVLAKAREAAKPAEGAAPAEGEKPAEPAAPSPSPEAPGAPK